MNEAKVQFGNSEKKLKAGMSIEVEFEGKTYGVTPTEIRRGSLRDIAVFAVCQPAERIRAVVAFASGACDTADWTISRLSERQSVYDATGSSLGPEPAYGTETAGHCGPQAR